MKHIGIAILLMLPILVAPRAGRAQDLDSFLREMKSPPAEVSQSPFWFWNGQLDPQEIRRQVREMASQGVRSVTPHPRFGMDRREYLEAPFWAAFDATIDEAKKVGSKIVIYDEYNWPSGGAGGRVTDGHPEFYPHGLDYIIRDAEGPAELKIERPEPGEKQSGEFQNIVSAFLVPADFPVFEPKAASEFSSKPWGQISADGSAVSGQILAGKQRVVVFFLARALNPSPLDPGSNSFVDYFNPDATRRFVELTHEGYRKRYGAEFGKTITAIFTDEPQALTAGPFPWTPRFAQEFRQRRGYDLMPHLLALCDERYPDGYKHRAAYWQTAADMFGDHFLGVIADWCKRNNIAFTGHVFQEFISSWGNAPQLMDWQRRLDWPGLDALGPRISSRDAKIVTSVAHLENKPHLMCESMGLAGGWNCSLDMIRRGHQFLGVMGVDTFIPHAMFYTVENPRIECPPSFFFQNPYWKYYHRVTAITDRICLFNRQGVHQAPVAVYYPIESLWADSPGGRGRGARVWASRQRPNASSRATIDTFDSVVNMLGAGPWDCDVADASLIQRSQITSDSRLKMGPETFSCVIVPAVKTIDPKAVVKLDAFAQAGGTLLFVGRVPDRCYPDADQPATTALATWATLAAGAKDSLTPHGRGRVAVLSSTRNLTAVLRDARIPSVMDFPIARPRDVFFIARQTVDAGLWLLINEGDDATFDVILPWSTIPGGQLPRPAFVRSIDTTSGVATILPSQAADAGIRCTLTLERGSSLILAVSRDTPFVATAPKPIDLAPAAEITQWTFQPVPSALDKGWTDRVEGLQPVELPLWRMRGRAWERIAGWTAAEFDDKSWNQVAAVRGGAQSMAASVLLRTVLPAGTRAMRLPLPVTGEYELSVNGQVVQKRMDLAPAAGELDISKFAKGENDVLAIEIASHIDQSGLTAPPVALVAPIKTGLRSWKDMGLSWYAGRGLYESTVNVPSGRALDGAVLDLGEVQHYAEVYVNGKLAGLALWAPYRVNVGSLLRLGDNEISIVVSNSIANRFAWDKWGTRGHGKPDPSGLLGPVKLMMAR